MSILSPSVIVKLLASILGGVSSFIKVGDETLMLDFVSFSNIFSYSDNLFLLVIIRLLSSIFQ